MAILPFYLNLMFGVDSVLLRLVRILRIFKLSSRIEGTKTVVEALRASFRSLLIPVYMLIVITLVFGAAFWLAEQGSESVGADGETVRIFDDGSVSEVTGIVRAGWVIIVTMTTVGYGDITPSTAAGRMVCVIAMLFGVLYVRCDRRWRVARVWVCMAHAGVCVRERRCCVAGGRSYMAMPIAIVGNNFWKAYEKHMKGKDDAKADKCVAPPVLSMTALVLTSCACHVWLPPQQGPGGGAATPHAASHVRTRRGFRAQARPRRGHDGPPCPQASQDVQGP